MEGGAGGGREGDRSHGEGTADGGLHVRALALAEGLTGPRGGVGEEGQRGVARRLGGVANEVLRVGALLLGGEGGWEDEAAGPGGGADIAAAGEGGEGGHVAGEGEDRCRGEWGGVGGGGGGRTLLALGGLLGGLSRGLPVPCLNGVLAEGEGAVVLWGGREGGK